MDNNRREFLKIMAAGAAVAALPAYALQPKKRKAGNLPAQTVLPRWRGFNLQYLFTKGRYSGPGRVDAKYEDFHGHKLDRKLLNLMQKCE